MHNSNVGVVVIGRNEGERLRRCLSSVVDGAARIYVDSGSTDGSQEIARSLGFDVVDLDTSLGFTAARARNAGLQRLGDIDQPEFVQFVDGDCEVRENWIEQAQSDFRNDVAVVFGRRRVGSSRVDLQACKLEYSIVSPK